MRLVINGRPVEIQGDAAISFDAETDELTINSRPTKRQAVQSKRELLMIEGPAPKRIGAPAAKLPKSKAALESAILEMVRESAEPVYQIALTKALIGYSAGAAKIKYFRLLLSEMVDRGLLLADHGESRVRYKLASAERDIE